MVQTPDSTVYQRFGERLRALREARGLSQREVAEAIGCTQSTYSQWERALVGVPLGQAYRLAAFFDEDLGELLEPAS